MKDCGSLHNHLGESLISLGISEEEFGNSVGPYSQGKVSMFQNLMKTDHIERVEQNNKTSICS